jgi:hypothetical protein
MDWAQDEFDFLGMHFKMQPDHSINIDMAAYTITMLKKRWTPEMAEVHKKRRGEISPSDEDIFKVVDDPSIKASEQDMTQIVFILQARGDIRKEFQLITSCGSNPGPSSWKLLRRVTYYLHDNQSSVVNVGSYSSTLTLYSDAGYVVHADVKSRKGIFIILGDNVRPILTKSKKLDIVTPSSTESESLALFTDGFKKCQFISKIMAQISRIREGIGPHAWKVFEMTMSSLVVNIVSNLSDLTLYVDRTSAEHANSKSHTGIFITLGDNRGLIMTKSKNQNIKIIAKRDNMSTFQIAKNGEGIGGKAKHLIVRYNFLRYMIEECMLIIEQYPTENMIPDCLTKDKTKLRDQVIRMTCHGDKPIFMHENLVADNRVGSKREK